MSRSVALIVAAGRGVRLGGGVPKQYRALGGVPMLRRTVLAFRRHAGVDAVRVVIHADDRARHDAALRGLDVLAPVTGGASRQDSVRRGLESLEEIEPERVLIHDAARPFVDAATIARVLAALDRWPGALAAVPVVDTLKRARAGVPPRVAETVARQGLWRAQTPQAFRFADILAAHRAAPAGAFTDDAQVAEAAGLDVALVEGSEDNFKVTNEDDLRRAEARLAAGAETRTAGGFDVHAFGPGDHVWLCGVRIDHDRGLRGHSDADVGLHALTDALLGTIGAGDIGSHFPDTEARWKGASSDRFVREARSLVAARGGVIAHVDLTLMCERPRLRPHHEAMVARVAQILDLSPARVSIKATTCEGLGFVGRGEGIAAQALATIRLADGI